MRTTLIIFLLFYFLPVFSQSYDTAPIYNADTVNKIKSKSTEDNFIVNMGIGYHYRWSPLGGEENYRGFLGNLSIEYILTNKLLISLELNYIRMYFKENYQSLNYYSNDGRINTLSFKFYVPVIKDVFYPSISLGGTPIPWFNGLNAGYDLNLFFNKYVIIFSYSKTIKYKFNAVDSPESLYSPYIARISFGYKFRL